MVRVKVESALLYLSLVMLVVAITLALIQRYVASVMSLIAGLTLLNHLRGGSCGDRSEGAG
ncbi:MAG: hypothetical protein QXS42_07200 [Zestosphaera sp.]